MINLELIGRTAPLFEKDLLKYEEILTKRVSQSRFLVIGGGGTIGKATTKAIFSRNPLQLDVVDLSENSLVELVRDIRSSMGYLDGEFATFAVDCGTVEFDNLFINRGPYDYVLNFSALKHVRSEKDPWTLMRMIEVNILNTIKTINSAAGLGTRKYFCVSTDKAVYPANMMGASKRIMEHYLMHLGDKMPISTARFANVAFSDGSLLHGFDQRMAKRQPLSAPKDIKRYFVLPEESGQLCLMSTILGNNKDIFFPKLSAELNLVSFTSIATRYLASLGFEPYICDTEEEARASVETLAAKQQWPCYFFTSDTTGEKSFEEFTTEDEVVDLDRFESLGVVRNTREVPESSLEHFVSEIARLRETNWNKEDLVLAFKGVLPDFEHIETGKHLDGKM
jgi:UDP-N-acetylglucosamine 4,6-dehydratase